jgi:hypothetical protein
VTFTFVGSAAEANIRFGFGTQAGACAFTLLEWNADGSLKLAELRVVENVYRGPGCRRTIEHEVGHAIGFIDHTADGGLMDLDGGNTQFTEPVVTMIRNLYSLAPGTFVGPGITRELPRSGGRITIVDPVRQ